MFKNTMTPEFHSWLSQNRAQFKAAFEHHVSEMLPTYPSQLHDAIRYVVKNCGKYFRPTLCMASAHRLGLEPGLVLPLAFAIEAIHTYSLVHDDLPAMDDDDLRRGQPSCHKAFDEATAILVGDGLQTLAFSTIADSALNDKAKVMAISILAKASGVHGMVGGQMHDMQASSTGNNTVEHLDQLHRLKTGALIEAAIVLPLTVSKPNETQELQKLKELAQNLGLAFQIQDDILDAEGSTQTLGKTAGSDLSSGKLTYPALIGLNASKVRVSELYERCLTVIHELRGETQYLGGIVLTLVGRDH